MSFWRQARAIALLPGMGSVVVPAILLWLGPSPDVGWGGPLAAVTVAAGAALIAAGLALWLWTVRLFARIGRGTLAPWDPTRTLVIVGPYGLVRNPMITAVLAALLGEAALFGSAALLAWATVFFGVNWAYFVLHEEPELAQRFGEPYRRYQRHVPRWIPRRRAWRPAP